MLGLARVPPFINIIKLLFRFVKEFKLAVFDPYHLCLISILKFLIFQCFRELLIHNIFKLITENVVDDVLLNVCCFLYVFCLFDELEDETTFKLPDGLILFLLGSRYVIWLLLEMFYLIIKSNDLVSKTANYRISTPYVCMENLLS